MLLIFTDAFYQANSYDHHEILWQHNQEVRRFAYHLSAGCVSYLWVFTYHGVVSVLWVFEKLCVWQAVKGRQSHVIVLHAVQYLSKGRQQGLVLHPSLILKRGTRIQIFFFFNVWAKLIFYRQVVSTEGDTQGKLFKTYALQNHKRHCAELLPQKLVKVVHVMIWIELWPLMRQWSPQKWPGWSDHGKTVCPSPHCQHHVDSGPTAETHTLQYTRLLHICMNTEQICFCYNTLLPLGVTGVEAQDATRAKWAL